LPGRRLGELGATLALWATIQRTHGLRDLAIKAFQLAFPLTRRSRYAWAQGICHQRASHVLRDLGRPDLALELLNQALWRFDEADDSLARWRCYVDRGTHYSSLPDFEESTAAYEVALERLPLSDWRFRAGALQGLAYNLHRNGKLVAALGKLERGIAECREPSQITAFLKWRLAAVLFDLNRIAEAKAAFREALALMGQFTSAGDIALVAIDYAEALVRAGHHSESVTLANDVTRWLPELRSNGILHRALSDLIDLALLGKMGLAEVESARAKIKPTRRDKELG
jgi:tetratricopeptide (TPR) repeat protein